MSNTELPKLDRATIRAVLDLFSVEGSDFYFNEANNYGCITMKLFTGEGDPFVRFRGEAEMGEYGKRGGGTEVRPTGCYSLNDRLIDEIERLVAERAQWRAERGATPAPAPETTKLSPATASDDPWFDEALALVTCVIEDWPGAREQLEAHLRTHGGATPRRQAESATNAGYKRRVALGNESVLPPDASGSLTAEEAIRDAVRVLEALTKERGRRNVEIDFAMAGLNGILAVNDPAPSVDDVFEQYANKGYSPALVFDDDGRWAVSDMGGSPVPLGENGHTETVGITSVVTPEQWKPTIREAVEAFIAANPLGEADEEKTDA